MDAVCPICGTMFKQRTKNHVFDKRKCFQENYNRKSKEERNSNRFPSFLCPSCHKLTKLDFNPKKKYMRWNEFSCPHCGYKNNFEY